LNLDRSGGGRVAHLFGLPVGEDLQTFRTIGGQVAGRDLARYDEAGGDAQSPALSEAILWGGGYNPYEAAFIRGYEDAANGRAQAPLDQAFARIAYGAGFAAAG